MGTSMSKESELIQRFIRDRQTQLVQRAIATLTTARDEELGFQFHRLAGTLGSYHLDSCANLLREFEQQMRSGSVAEPDALRAQALTELDRVASVLQAVA